MENFGISEFLGADCGFTCVLKERYADFVVNEIDAAGNVVELSETAVPAGEPSESVEQTSFDDVFSDAQLSDLEALVANDTPAAQTTINCDEAVSKEGRTRIHEAIRSKFGAALQSRTLTDADGTRIVVEKASGNKGRKRKFWPKDRGDFCHFTLWKENKDGAFAVATVAAALGLRANDVCVAGTKDKRAVTTQRACVYRVEAARLAALNRRLRGMRVGNFLYSAERIGLGSLSGNRFCIVLRCVPIDSPVCAQPSRFRNLSVAEDDARRQFEEWKRVGFINYYGDQRFGTLDVSTAQVGRRILLQDWAGAVELILQTANAQSSTDADKSSGRRRHTSIEGQLQQGLQRHGANNYCNALKELPRTVRSLYVHAYQSLLWNQAVSERVRRYGCEVFDDDFVWKETTAGSESEEVTLIKSAERKVTVFDVLVPLPSAAEPVAHNQTTAIIDKLLKEDGLSTAHFQRLTTDYALHGAYRPMMLRCEDAIVQFFRYDDAAAAADSAADGRFLAARLTFDLPAGCYATMALRQLTRMDMSKRHQMTLNDYSASPPSSTADAKRTETAQVDECSASRHSLDVRTPVGVLRAEACDRGVHSIALPTCFVQPPDCTSATAVDADDAPVDGPFAELVAWLRAYFARSPDGQRRPRVCALEAADDSFAGRCLRQLARVGFGETLSYSQLAERAGAATGAARAVGQVMRNNPTPLLVPCHRVVRSDGTAGGFGGKSESPLKDWLLLFETQT